MPVLIMGIVFVAIGWFARKKPESWWFRRFGEDRYAELSEDRRWYLRFAGMILIILAGCYVWQVSIVFEYKKPL
ncbi:hypothetical protein FHS19_004321 [Paenibacillus rhizosphaerae]|uniref:DUF6199 domain-containing protein n=1 Tax=Paenibacillus rhizosphaerae TaxID=297318 RepID=A0A839TS41_9BACL|nr:hypothetical protein [Paenibacillus rhizosphaerae]MBB3129646.1 hypothetical protein [Paenibacillus rhizosphaerae]